MKTLIFTFLIFFFGCTKQSSVQTAAVIDNPSEVVRSFVELSAASKTGEDKRKLLSVCGGELKRAFERMSEEEFKLIYLSGQIKVEKIEFIKTEVQNETALVHYRVVVENKQGTETTQETNEREVLLTKTTGGWTIDAIRLKGSDKLAFTRGMMF